jgi:hypothetical protein
VSDRRRFLLRGAATVGGLLLAAGCRGEDDDGAPSGDTADDPPRTGDTAVIALAASLENLIVASYTAALDAVPAGDIEDVPPAVTALADRAVAHHSEHAAAWNRLLAGAGQEPVVGVNRTVQAALADPGLAAARDGPGLTTFVLGLEGILAATYLDAAIRLEDRAALALAASIRPVELQHTAVLHFFLGQYPVPDAFTSREGARPITDEIG